MMKEESKNKSSFQGSLGSIKRLAQTRIPPHRKQRKPIPVQSLRDAREVMKDLLSDDYEPADIETGEELSFARPGLQHSVLRKLRRGQYAVEAELDLHGYTVLQARDALLQFIRDVRGMNKRCVRIIHGKGNRSQKKQPVLKGKVNGWLRQKDEVLAFCSARRADGGTGAAYVLLKRKS